MSIQRKSLRLPKIAVALCGDHMAGRAEALADNFPFLEFRLDTVADPHEAVFAMGALLRRKPELQVIATCRRTANGGSFLGTAADEIDALRQAAAVGAHILDLSLETAEEASINPNALLPLRRGSSALMLSWHDFYGTPALPPVLDRMQRIGADLYKIVPTAERLTDAFVLLDLIEQLGSEGNLVAMSMGMPGVLTRILGPMHGSVFTFAAETAGTGTAPGQIDAATLRDLYRAEHITRDTLVYGVFGKPIGGSRSPVMLNAAFREAAVDAVYLPLETDDSDELFLALQRLRMAGASVTMPLKERVLSRISDLDPLAAMLGAANTLTRLPNGSMRGSNTDALGIIQPLEQRIALEGSTALVLGAGGVARAAVFALRERGCAVTIVNRTHERGESLARETGAAFLDSGALSGRTFDIVLNATPFGMTHATMAAPVDFAATRSSIFFDLVYYPLETPLLIAARAAGIDAIPGVEMFVEQGAEQFRTWTALPAPLETMRRQVLSTLQSTL